MQFRRTFADRLQNSGDQRREFLAVLRHFPFPPALKNVYPVKHPVSGRFHSLGTDEVEAKKVHPKRTRSLQNKEPGRFLVLTTVLPE